MHGNLFESIEAGRAALLVVESYTRRAHAAGTMSDMVMRGKIVDSPEGPMYIDHSADYEVMNREHDEENEEDFHETIDKARRGAGEHTSRS